MKRIVRGSLAPTISQSVRFRLGSHVPECMHISTSTDQGKSSSLPGFQSMNQGSNGSRLSNIFKKALNNSQFQSFEAESTASTSTQEKNVSDQTESSHWDPSLLKAEGDFAHILFKLIRSN
jgi:hypothetical protein